MFDLESFVNHVAERREDWKGSEYLTEEGFADLDAGVRAFARLARDMVTEDGRDGMYFVAEEGIPEFVWLRRSVSHFGKVSIVGEYDLALTVDDALDVFIASRPEAAPTAEEEEEDEPEYLAPSVESIVGQESFARFIADSLEANDEEPYLNMDQYDSLRQHVRDYATAHRSVVRVDDGREGVLFTAAESGDTVWFLRRSKTHDGKISTYGDNAPFEEFVSRLVADGVVKETATG